MTESQMKQTISDTMRSMGWTLEHPTSVGAGDQLFIKNCFIIAIESKLSYNKQQVDQVSFQAYCSERNIPYYLATAVDRDDARGEAIRIAIVESDKYSRLLSMVESSGVADRYWTTILKDMVD